MKYLFLALSILITYSAFAKEAGSLKDFNKAVGENISDVLSENPQMYETKPVGRKPASVNRPIQDAKSVEKLDEVIEQADTHTSW